MAKLADAHGLGPCGETLGGSSPLIRTRKTMNRHELKTTERDIDFKLPTPLGIDSSVPKFLDTRYQFNIRDQIMVSPRYISSITGKKYSDFQAMREE